MYIINDYQLVSVASDLYISSESKGAKISNSKLGEILKALQEQPKLEISEEALENLANRYEVNFEQLKAVLMQQLEILKPMLSRKFPQIVISSDDHLITELLLESFEKQYNVQIAKPDCLEFPKHALVIFYRNNYSHADFKKLYHHLGEDIHLVTAGIIHHLLVIDNIYFEGSGLPTHVSNLHQLMAYLHSEVPATKNNWLLYYRNLVKNNADTFPEPAVNACQRGYIAYCLHQFASQFTNLWKKPTAMDQLNWFWHADLTTFNVHREVSIHSPFSEFDMKLNLAPLLAKEEA